MKDILVRLGAEESQLAVRASNTRGLLREAASEIARLRGAAPPMPFDAKTTDIVGVHIDTLANLVTTSDQFAMIKRVISAARFVRHYPEGWAGAFKEVSVETHQWDELGRLLQEYFAS